VSAKKDKSGKAVTAPSNGNPSTPQEKPECFVIMPISDPEGYEPRHFGQVFDDLFTPACDMAGYRAVRADQVRQTNLIHLDVLQKIVESPMALCDLSNRNPNVMFELGLRQAFDKPVVLVQEYGTPPIFDITPLRYTEYHKEMLYRQVVEDQKKITAAILATKEAIKNSKSVNSIVKLLSLTNSASLTNISEGEKESALFQIIMAEIGNLRKELSESSGRRERLTGSRPAGRWETEKRGVVSELNRIFEQATMLGNSLRSASADQRVAVGQEIEILWDRLINLIDYVTVHKLYDDTIAEDLNRLQRYVADIRNRYQSLEQDMKLNLKEK
jgi:hypothetical protein